MFSLKTLLALGLLGATVLAVPVSSPAKRQSGGATCGYNSYDANAVNDAQQTGCQDQQSGQTVGRNRYPHSENNYEGLAFNGAAPYYEFPIMADGTIFDGSEGPGPDRVVFNDYCELAGVVTHTGAGGNNFLLCDSA